MLRPRQSERRRNREFLSARYQLGSPTRRLNVLVELETRPGLERTEVACNPAELLLVEMCVGVGAFTNVHDRRMPGSRSGWRRSISSNRATGRRPGVACSMGMISASQIESSRSGRRRPRGAFRREGRRGSASRRAPVVAPIPARAAAIWRVWVLRWCMYSLACWSVMCVPGTRRSPGERTATPAQTSRRRRLPSRRGTNLAGADLWQGYAAPPVSPGNHNPDRRAQPF